jgi:hypothetical protein
MVEISAPKSIRPVPNARARSALRAWCPARERDLKRRHRPTGGMPLPLQQRAEREFGADHVDRGIGGPDLVADQAAGTGAGQRDVVDPGAVQQGRVLERRRERVTEGRGRRSPGR